MTVAVGLADGFDEANDALITFAQSCTDAQWRTIVPGEGWPVGVVIHHCAETHLMLTRWVESARNGEDIVDTAEGVDAANAAHALDRVDVDPVETVELLRQNGARVSAVMRSLTDADLARSVGFGPAGGASFSVEQLAGVAARHCQVHFASAQAALGS